MSSLPFKVTPGEIKDVKIAAATTGLFLWPIPTTIELLTGESIALPLATFATMYYVGGGFPWQMSFGDFFKAYLAGGAVFAGGIYLQANQLKKELAGEVDSV